MKLKNPTFTIRPLTADDREWVAQFIVNRWGAEMAVAHGIPIRDEIELEMTIPAT